MSRNGLIREPRCLTETAEVCREIVRVEAYIFVDLSEISVTRCLQTVLAGKVMRWVVFVSPSVSTVAFEPTEL